MTSPAVASATRKAASQQAFIVRMNTGGGDVAELGRELGLLLVGWSGARDLDDPTLDYDAFRDRVHEAHYAADDDYRRSGRAAGVLWRFMREMQRGDLIVVPRPGSFWIGEVTGDAFESDAGDLDDTVHRRPVAWLDEAGISRRRARSALVSRMKSRGTVTNATDLLDDIRSALVEIGVVVTTTVFDERSRAYALQRADETGKELLLFDGPDFSQLIIDQGLRGLVT